MFIEDIKLMLGEAAANFSDAQIQLAYKQAEIEVESYCRRSLDKELEMIAEKISVVNLLRTNTQGLTSQSFSGVSESYLDGYPAEIQAVLDRKRKIRVL